MPLTVQDGSPSGGMVIIMSTDHPTQSPAPRVLAGGEQAQQVSNCMLIVRVAGVVNVIRYSRPNSERFIEVAHWLASVHSPR